jgi:hypothetical protein
MTRASTDWLQQSAGQVCRQDLAAIEAEVVVSAIGIAGACGKNS